MKSEDKENKRGISSLISFLSNMQGNTRLSAEFVLPPKVLDEQYSTTTNSKQMSHHTLQLVFTVRPH